MKKDNENVNSLADKAVDLVLGEKKDAKVYSHAVFCQCILPVRSLPKEEEFYQVQHGNTSLIIQSGVLIDESSRGHKMEVPSGAKARLLFPYIIDQAKRTGRPVVDMGKSLREYMVRNNIPIGGKNAKEITRQIHNIAASNIYLGVRGETETHKFSSQKNYRVASEISFWTEKQPDQLSIWSPYLTVSDEFMAAIEKHTVLLNLQPLIELQANPRAMDAYTWLSYRVQSVRYPVKISYDDLHTIFGKQTKELKNFKADFKKAIQQALPFLPYVNVDLNSDKKHLIIENTSFKHFYLPDESNFATKPAVEGVFGELKAIGLSLPVIEKITKQYEPDAIKKAAKITKQNLDSGKVKNPAGFFTKALKEGWEPTATDTNEDVTLQDTVKYDPKTEAKIKPIEWRKVRAALYTSLGEAVFVSWIYKIECESCSDNEVIFKVSSRFQAQFIENNYLDKIATAWEQVIGKKPSIAITVAKELAPA